MLDCSSELKNIIFKDIKINPSFNSFLLKKLKVGQSKPQLEQTYFIFEYQLIKEILKNSNFTSQQIGYGNYVKLIKLLPLANLELRGDVLFSDFEQHTKLRNILVQNYMKIYSYFPVIIDELVQEHFSSLSDEDRICLVHQISTPLSEKIFLALSGLGKFNEYKEFNTFFILSGLYLML